jgi:hypothetical protein
MRYPAIRATAASVGRCICAAQVKNSVQIRPIQRKYAIYLEGPFSHQPSRSALPKRISQPARPPSLPPMPMPMPSLSWPSLGLWGAGRACCTEGHVSDNFNFRRAVRLVTDILEPRACVGVFQYWRTRRSEVVCLPFADLGLGGLPGRSRGNWGPT